MAKIDVLLVDGVGRPQIQAISVMLVAPIVITYEHPQRAKNEPPVVVHFDRSPDEIDPEGRHIYRQRGSGFPTVRFHPDYLRRSTIRQN